MPSYLKAGLTVEAASQICRHQCKAQCCRGPLVLQLTSEEISTLEDLAGEMAVSLSISRASGGGGWLRFSDHPGEHCPYLDDATSVCRIYDNRPQRCRDFPERPTPGCPISGG